MPHTYRDSGVILQKYNLGEADVLVTLLLREHGLVRSVAKGARRLTSRKRGHVELFNQVEVLLSQGRNLDVLSEAEAVNSFDGWRNDLARISLAYYATDITLMLLPEHEPYPEVLAQLEAVFGQLGKAAQPELLIRWYEVQLLWQLGYWAEDQLRSASANAVQLLQQCPRLAAEQVVRLRVSPQLNQELERMMSTHISPLLEKQVKSQVFVDQVRELDRRTM